MEKRDQLLEKMTEYDRGDPKRIQHFWKVWAFAKWIGTQEGLDAHTQEILEAAAIVHDIGIRIAERKYGSCTGKLQEQEGPPEAGRMLLEVGYGQEIIERVQYLVGHHHSYDAIDGIDYQILVEADFLVNLYEDPCTHKATQAAKEKIFRTTAGMRLFEPMFE